MIRGITFADQLITSKDDAHCRNLFLNYGVGITKGCNITSDESNIYVSGGYFVVGGRFVNIVGQETITPDPIEASVLNCVLVFEIDLSKINTTEEFNQGYFKILKSPTAQPEVTREDLDADGTIYQLPFVNFKLTPTGIIDVEKVISTFSVTRVWDEVATEHAREREKFKSYFDNYKDHNDEYVANELKRFSNLVTEQMKEFTDLINEYTEILFEKIAEYELHGFAEETDLFDLNNGMKASDVEFLEDGSIKETYINGTKLVQFLVDGSIRETVTYDSGRKVVKTTSFLQNGNIKEVIN